MVKLSSLGDVIQTLPVLHDLQQHVPGVQIDWVVEEAFADLLHSVPSIQRVLPIAQRRWRQQPFGRASRHGWRAFWATLHESDYDLVIDFQGLIKSAWVARGAGLAPAGVSVTYANGSDLCAYEWPVRWLVKRTVPMEQSIHAVARYRSLAARACGQAASDWLAKPPTYPWPVVKPSEPRLAVFAHGTTRLDNQWPFEHWLALGQGLIQTGWQVAVPQSNDRESQWAEQLQTALGEGSMVWPRMDLASLRLSMAKASLVVGVDSGLSHLAIAQHLPVVQIFSQPRVARAGPVGYAHQEAVGGESPPQVDAVWSAYWRVMHAAPPRD